MWDFISGLMIFLMLLCIIAIPVLLITFVVLWATKKRKLWVGLSALFCFIGIFIFAIIFGIANYKGMTPEERLEMESATESAIESQKEEAEKEAAEQAAKEEAEKEQEEIEEEKEEPAECDHTYVDIESEINIDRKKNTVKQKCSSCGETKTEVRDMTDAELENYFKENCKSFTYEEMARYPDENKGKFVVATGEVFQVQESLGTTILLVNVTKVDNEFLPYYEDPVYVNYKFSDGLKILEGDIITMYGRLNGEETYLTVLGSTNTIPRLEIYYAELDN
jgi:hypothetical protein